MLREKQVNSPNYLLSENAHNEFRNNYKCLTNLILLLTFFIPSVVHACKNRKMFSSASPLDLLGLICEVRGKEVREGVGNRLTKMSTI